MFTGLEMKACQGRDKITQCPETLHDEKKNPVTHRDVLFPAVSHERQRMRRTDAWGADVIPYHGRVTMTLTVWQDDVTGTAICGQNKMKTRN